MKHNATNLKSAFDWLHDVVASCLNGHFEQVDDFEVGALDSDSKDSLLAAFIAKYEPTHEEFVVLMLTLIPHLKPDFFNKIIAEYLPEGGDFPEFGGVRAVNHRGIIPTGETAQFILAGDNLEQRLEIQRILSTEHWFVQKHILWLDPVREGEPIMSGRLVLDPEIIEQLTIGTVSKPRFSINFPAEYIETEMEWDDLVLHPNTLRQIHEIENWIKYNDTLLQDWGMKKKNKTRLPRAVLRTTRYGQDTDRDFIGQIHRQRRLPHRSLAGGIQIHR